MDKVKEFLFSKQELGYREFSAKLIPTVKIENIVGVRMPELKKIVKTLSKEDKEKYLNNLPHEYMEEYHIHMYLLNEEKDINRLIENTEKVLPFIDNWATCDIGIGKISKKYPEIIEKKVYEWLKSKHEYTVRFAVTTLRTNFIKENFNENHLKVLSEIQTDEYYINMAIAWYLCECYIRHEKEVLYYLEKNMIVNDWVHNKAIQKMKESLKIDKDKKIYLNTLKRK
ncbi:DNA alkylation repair protein [Streptobacillus ratti]|uniref:DNA alkylation repair protein n=1 Tax=Streptobacillus ratti TaxID=1720557 RepID=UPI000932F661|nr:DNA alkylation repair protein [Streptobacillus ratti]